MDDSNEEFLINSNDEDDDDYDNNYSEDEQDDIIDIDDDEEVDENEKQSNSLNNKNNNTKSNESQSNNNRLKSNHSSSKPSSSSGTAAATAVDDEFKYEVLTPDKIVQYMIECIKEVNQVLELTPTTTRILLNHFRWDKEKLMERFYDGDQDRLFNEAHIINPFKQSSSLSQSSKKSRVEKSGGQIGSSQREETCEICILTCPKNVIYKKNMLLICF
jgi:hypothetical protein